MTSLKREVYRDEAGKIVTIPFDLIFEQDIKSYISEFNLSKKRNFSGIIDNIVSDLNFLIDHNEEFVYSYAEIKYKIVASINDGEEYSKSEFIDDVLTTLITDDIITLISAKVNAGYDINLDDESKKKKNANEELQITDQHNKGYLKISIASRIVIPLLMEYSKYFSDKNLEVILFTINCKLFERFEPSTNAEAGNILYNKLYKFIDSRVSATRYSDQKMWNYYKNLAIDTNIITHILMKRLIVNIIPKIENNTNVISYLHVVLRNQIGYQFDTNNPINYNPLNLNLADSEGLTNFDRLESNMIRVDEGFVILNKITVQTEVQKVMDKYGITIVQEELDYYKDNIVQNKIQEMIVFLFFSKYLGSYNNNFYNDFDSYVTYCVILRKWLIQNGFTNLEKFIVGSPEKRVIEKHTINRKKFLAKLKDSKEYKNLVDSKYRFTVDLIINSNIIEKIIATLSTNKFYDIPRYEEFLSGKFESYEIDVPIENIGIEVLQFIKEI